MIMILQIFLFLLINTLIVFYFETLSKYFNLYDYPLLDRKKQKVPISLFGGFIFFINFVLFIFFDIFYNNNSFLISLGFNTNIKVFFFLIVFCFIYLIGYVDDKIDIRPFNRLVLLLTLTFLIVYFNPNFNIKTLRSNLFFNDIDLFFFGSLFSTLCIVAYMNALNMFDGINLISFLHFFSIPVVFILENFLLNFSILLGFSLLIFSYLNLKNLTFFGDSGIYILSFICALMVIDFYDTYKINIEYVLIIIFLPMVDFFRLFFVRIYKGNDPFKGDENHFHHIITKRFNFKTTIFIYILFIYLPILINYFFRISEFLLLIMIITYFTIIKFIKLNTSHNNE